MGTIQNINTINKRLSRLKTNFGEDSTIYKNAVADVKTTFGSENVTISKKTGVVRVKESKVNVRNDLAIQGANKRISTPGAIRKDAKKEYKRFFGDNNITGDELDKFINGLYKFGNWFEQNRTEIYAAARAGNGKATKIMDIMGATGGKKSINELQAVLTLWEGLQNEEENRRKTFARSVTGPVNVS